MAGMDEIVINTRERPLSSDINNLQAMIHRNVLDILRFGFENRDLVTGMPTGSPRDCVLGGLEVVPSGNDVEIQPGALVQWDLALAPAPGSLDSAYRIGTLRTAEIVDMPDPGSDTWYLIEARMERVTTSTESRDILDAMTGVFAPAAVPKQRERRVEFQIVTGNTSAPTPTGAGWVPLAVVLRPSGGPATTAAHILDVRPMWRDGLDQGDLAYMASVDGNIDQDATLKGTIATVATSESASNNVSVKFGAAVPGARARGLVTIASNVTAAAYLEPGLSFSADTWYYLYLCPWNGLLPWRSDLSTALPQRGVLVISDTAANILRSNSNAIDLPAPFANHTCPTSEAVLVCPLRRNSANTGWVAMQSDDARDFQIQSFGAGSTSGVGVTATVLVYPIPLPAACRSAKLQAYWQISGGAANANIRVRVNGGSNDFLVLLGYGNNIGNEVFDWPMRTLGSTVNVRLESGLLDHDANIAQVIGFRI